MSQVGLPFAEFVLSVCTIPVTLQFALGIERLLANIADISFPRILTHGGPSICDLSSTRSRAARWMRYRKHENRRRLVAPFAAPRGDLSLDTNS
jgi:hypothetical protein